MKVNIAPSAFEEAFPAFEEPCEELARPAYEMRRWEKMARGVHCEEYHQQPEIEQ